MSFGQLTIGIAAMATAGTFALQAVLPKPAPIEVHVIAFDGKTVTQDRTVTTDQTAFYAQWAATVEDAKTGNSVRHCEGNGAYAYKPGRKAVQFTLPDWTGRPECTPESLPPGSYILRASWRWGSEGTSATSEPFEVGQ